jgi:hypothetical protein
MRGHRRWILLAKLLTIKACRGWVRDRQKKGGSRRLFLAEKSLSIAESQGPNQKNKALFRKDNNAQAFIFIIYNLCRAFSLAKAPQTL